MPRRFRLASSSALLAALAGLSACAPGAEPPGRSAASEEAAALPLPPEDGARGSLPAVRPARLAPKSEPDQVAPGSVARKRQEPGRGHRIASIAMRTWIYAAPSDQSPKLGYLRAGAVVERGEEPVGFATCAGGFYRVAPRGHVCVGKGASLDLEHPVVLAAGRGPSRGEPTPYAYAMSREPGPHLYFRLPSEADQRRVEGRSYAQGTVLARRVVGERPVDPPPAFLASGGELPKPYGAAKKLHYSVHTGRANPDSAFGLIHVFEWTGRLFGLTTELDLIPLDRTKPATLSPIRGARAEAGGIPAIVRSAGATRMRRTEAGSFVADGPLPYRSGVVLTGLRDEKNPAMAELEGGGYVAISSLFVPEPREDPVGYARAGRRWIDVSIEKQVLVAYEGKRPVFATLVSTGRGEMGDPETTQATVRGTFTIHAKHVSATMDGDESGDDFELHDVPYVQYFHEGYALHGAYWHDEFGKARSHGCVNLPPADAAWLFEFTDPDVPAEWHGAMKREGGTLVWIHR